MTKPIGHTEDYVRLVIDQLRAEFPNASGEVVRAAAKCRARYIGHPGRAAIFPRLVKG